MTKLRCTALCAAFGLALAFALPADAQVPQTRTLKMQSSWPASLTLQENFNYFAERVGKLSAGTLKIRPRASKSTRLPVGETVPF